MPRVPVIRTKTEDVIAPDTLAAQRVRRSLERGAKNRDRRFVLQDVSTFIRSFERAIFGQGQ